MLTTETTVPPLAPLALPFRVGDNAMQRVARLLQTEPAGSHLRIGVAGGGCSGFQYTYAFETTPPDADDLRIEQSGARIVVDPVSLDHLRGSILDYVETLGGSAFEISNPNTKSSCGCGNSFSLG